MSRRIHPALPTPQQARDYPESVVTDHVLVYGEQDLPNGSTLKVASLNILGPNAGGGFSCEKSWKTTENSADRCEKVFQALSALQGENKEKELGLDIIFLQEMDPEIIREKISLLGIGWRRVSCNRKEYSASRKSCETHSNSISSDSDSDSDFDFDSGLDSDLELHGFTEEVDTQGVTILYNENTIQFKSSSLNAKKRAVVAQFVYGDYKFNAVNFWGRFHHLPSKAENSFITLISQSDGLPVLIGGDINSTIVTAKAGRRNVVTTVPPLSLNPSKGLGSDDQDWDAPDFIGFSNGYNRDGSDSKKTMLEGEVKPVQKLRQFDVLTCKFVDDSVSRFSSFPDAIYKHKLIMRVPRSQYEYLLYYQGELRQKFQDNSIEVYPTTNGVNDRGYAVCFNNDAKSEMAAVLGKFQKDGQLGEARLLSTEGDQLTKGSYAMFVSEENYPNLKAFLSKEYNDSKFSEFFSFNPSAELFSLICKQYVTGKVLGWFKRFFFEDGYEKANLLQNLLDRIWYEKRMDPNVNLYNVINGWKSDIRHGSNSSSNYELLGKQRCCFSSGFFKTSSQVAVDKLLESFNQNVQVL